MNRLRALADQGQSIWLDYIRRGNTRGGKLAELFERDGLRGVTSNPSIFQKAIAGSDDYRDVLDKLAGDASLDAKALYEKLAIVDIQEAADVLRPVYDKSEGADGFVSLEVAPSLGRHTDGTIAEARRLWAAVERPNLMIKVPGTPQGVRALEHLIVEGINVNVTLIFALDAYESIADAYIQALETRHGRGESLATVASVASFFVSRIDTEVDKRLAARGNTELQGRIAVANAKLAYRHYEKLVGSDHWKTLAAAGARPQRLLWASTGTKNEAYSDVMYVDELIGRDTVNTVPPHTLDAFRDHGEVRDAIGRDVDRAQADMAALGEAGVSMRDVTDHLLERGLELFADAMDGLLASVASIQRQAVGTRLNRLDVRPPIDLGKWGEQDTVERLWHRDAALWTGGDEGKWMGWLDLGRLTADLAATAAATEPRDYDQAIVLGMGGSSLCPDVLSKTYAADTKTPLRILDSTDPAQVATTHAALDPSKTLFIVASKSGSTTEPNAFMQYFLQHASAERFVAVTDPGSKLEAVARAEGFRAILPGIPEVGGRYSALSLFGMGAAAAMGLDTAAFLAEAKLMADACRAASATNPGVALGVALGNAANSGRDKLTLIASPAIGSFGAWLEQLLAESTGKQGKAIIPVDGESLADPGAYGDDRQFVYLRLRSTPDAAQDLGVQALERAGKPVIRIELDDIHALPQEFFRWEIATAVAGSLLAINPFNQPDVEASKIATRAMTDAFEQTGSLPPESPIFEGDGIALYTDDDNAAALGKHDDLEGYLRAHLGRLGSGDYFGLLAYVEMDDANQRAAQVIRHRVRDVTRCATCVGFGPRFLHSTGQAYKGGPASGVFLQVTRDDANDLPIPGQKYTFGVVKAAQARGDFEVLAQRERRALRVHLRAGHAGLAGLARAVEAALTKETN